MTEQTPADAPPQPISSEAAKAKWSTPVVILSVVDKTEKFVYASDFLSISGPS